METHEMAEDKAIDSILSTYHGSHNGTPVRHDPGIGPFDSDVAQPLFATLKFFFVTHIWMRSIPTMKEEFAGSAIANWENGNGRRIWTGSRHHSG